jgi:hypothetical protein
MRLKSAKVHLQWSLEKIPKFQLHSKCLCTHTRHDYKHRPSAELRVERHFSVWRISEFFIVLSLLAQTLMSAKGCREIGLDYIGRPPVIYNRRTRVWRRDAHTLGKNSTRNDHVGGPLRDDPVTTAVPSPLALRKRRSRLTFLRRTGHGDSEIVVLWNDCRHRATHFAAHSEGNQTL